jgi:cellulose synthase/poly-beta-1,6-N-acetylglucosamine synthase-like glycosyltransferase
MNAGAIVFCIGGAYIAYILFGYPALLAVLSHFVKNPPRRDDRLRSVCFIIAVRDGDEWIAQKLRSIFALDYPRDLMEVIVVSDGSTDDTERIVSGFGGVRLIALAGGGKAAALNAGIEAANHEILVFTDVRQELDPPSLKRIIACFGDVRVGVVSGDLRIRKGANQVEEQLSLYRRYEGWIRQRLSSIDSIFGATGSFYAMRRELASNIPPDTLLDDMYLPLGVFFRGYRLIYEMSARAFDVPTSLETEFSRKVRTLAGNLQILHMYPALLGPRNRMWFHFMSYKFGRLLLPYVLIAVAVTTFWLPPVARDVAAVIQLLFYILGWLDLAIPETWPGKRLSSAVRTFLVLMAADLCAIVIVFVPPAKLWKPTQVRSSRPTAAL